eukprot:1350390-Rhodomonas_salina.1
MQIKKLNARAKEASMKRKAATKELVKTKNGRYHDDDEDGVVSDASSSAAASSTRTQKKKSLTMKAFHHYSHKHGTEEWGKVSKKKKQEYVKEHRNELVED